MCQCAATWLVFHECWWPGFLEACRAAKFSTIPVLLRVVAHCREKAHASFELIAREAGCLRRSARLDTRAIVL